MSTAPRSNSPSTQLSDSTDGNANLRGNLGTISLVMTVIAYNGPMIVLAGVIPIIISIGNGLGAPATILALGLVVLGFAVGLNAMGARLTQPGAFYTYVTAGMGRSPGLAAGLLALIAYTAIGGGTYPLLALSIQNVLKQTFDVQQGPPWWVWALAAWAVVTVLSLYNIELSAKFLAAASIAEIVIVVVWHMRVLVNGGPEGRAVNVISSVFSGSYSMAFLFGILILTGFESLQVFRSETKDHVRTVPRATYVAVILLSVMHAVSAYVFIVAYGRSNAVGSAAADPTGSVLASISTFVAPLAADIANLLLATSTFASCLAIQSILARYMFAFGRDGIFPAALGRANTHYGSPMTASAVAGALAFPCFVIPALAGMDPNTSFAATQGTGGVSLITLYFITSIAVVVYFRRRENRQLSLLKTVVFPGAAMCALGVIVFMAATHFPDVIGQNRVVANVLLLLLASAIALGLFYAYWLRRNRPDIYSRIGNQSGLS